MLKRRAAAQRGLSLVELMIGIALGLFVTAAASLMLSSHLNDNRRLLLETQVQQDLRAAAEVITRDLRRAGYWQGAERGVWRREAAAQPDPYAAIDVAEEDGATEVTYSYSLDERKAAPDNVENDTVDATDRAGFRLRDGRIQMLLGAGGWQDVTDGATVNVTRLDIDLVSTTRTLEAMCTRACNGAANCPPTHTVRAFVVRIEGEALHDPAVQRSLQSTVRVRNDATQGACPT